MCWNGKRAPHFLLWSKRAEIFYPLSIECTSHISNCVYVMDYNFRMDFKILWTQIQAPAKRTSFRKPFVSHSKNHSFVPVEIVNLFRRIKKFQTQLIDNSRKSHTQLRMKLDIISERFQFPHFSVCIVCIYSVAIAWEVFFLSRKYKKKQLLIRAACFTYHDFPMGAVFAHYFLPMFFMWCASTTFITIKSVVWMSHFHKLWHTTHTQSEVDGRENGKVGKIAIEKTQLAMHVSFLYMVLNHLRR